MHFVANNGVVPALFREHKNRGGNASPSSSSSSSSFSATGSSSTSSAVPTSPLSSVSSLSPSSSSSSPFFSSFPVSSSSSSLGNRSRAVAAVVSPVVSPVPPVPPVPQAAFPRDVVCYVHGDDRSFRRFGSRRRVEQRMGELGARVVSRRTVCVTHCIVPEGVKVRVTLATLYTAFCW